MGTVKIGLLAWDDIGTDSDEAPFMELGLSRGHEMHQFALENITYVPRSGGGFDLMLRDEPAQSFGAVFSRARLYGDDWQDRVERLTLLSSVLGSRLHSPADAWVRGYSKFQCTQALANAGLPVLPLRSAATLAELKLACQEWGTVVVKPSFEFEGRGVERISDLADPAQAGLARDLLGKYRTLACMPFVPTQYGEYRINVAGDTCVTMFKLPPVGVWRCKNGQGGLFERIDTPPELADIARRATRLMGLTLSGVDALPYGNGYVILEVNPIPGALNALGAQARRQTLEGIFEWMENHM